MVGLITVEAILFGSLIVSYFYLRFYAPDWPMEGISKPSLVLPSIGAAVLVISSGPMAWADASIKRGNVRNLILGLVLALVSGLILWVGAHPVAAVLALLAFGIYVLVYTLWLKRRSPWNVVVGGLAGAAPPLVGWAAATGTLSPRAFLLGAIVFVWTAAHFWALALMRRREYARAGVPMLPVVRGERLTRRQILNYAGLTVRLTAIPVVGGTMGPVYAVSAATLEGILLAPGIRMHRRADGSTDRRFYFFTLLYLGGLFLAMLIDHAAGL